jgi:hypothetical protein
MTPDQFLPRTPIALTEWAIAYGARWVWLKEDARGKLVQSENTLTGCSKRPPSSYVVREASFVFRC